MFSTIRNWSTPRSASAKACFGRFRWTTDLGAISRIIDVDGAIICGTRLYLSVLADRPLIRLWRVVVSDVKQRQSAVIEASYLNRTHPLTEWILLGHSPVREKFISAAPFVPDRLIEELNDFDEQYDDNRSQLLFRLGGND